MNEEISTLLADIREQFLYLQELGAGDFSVELPEIKVQSPKSKVQSPAIAVSTSKPEIARERLEKFVSGAEVLKNIPAIKTENAPPKIETDDARTTRRSLLEATKLSKLPELPKRNNFNYSKNESNESGGNEPMPAKKTEEPQAASLFGDFTPSLPESTETIEEIRADIGDCTRCPLWEGRTKIVHSTGNRQADLMFVGEAPGADEDAQGKPFVGRSGQLLTKIIESIGLKREDVFIGNINRCRPPQNRQPTLPEAHTCRPFLTREIAVVRPKVIVVMGNTAMKNLLDTKEGITKLRGEFQDYYGIKVMPTFHPAYLLRDPSKKREVWEDMKRVREELNKS